VLVYYERMTCDLVMDVRTSQVKDASALEGALKTKISALGPQFSLKGLSKIDLFLTF